MSEKSKASRLLSNISAADVMTRELVEMVEAIFHIEDLYELSKRNSFIALNFFQLMANIDYVILTPGIASPVGESSVLAEAVEIFVGISGSKFPFTIKGKIAAVAECFRIQAAKMNALVDTNVIAAFMQGTGAAQIAQDAVNAFLAGFQQLQSKTLEAIPGVAKAAAVL